MNPVSLTLNILAIGLLPLAWGLLWLALRRQGAARWTGAAAGAVTFVVAARLLEPLALQASGLTGWLAFPNLAPFWVPVAFAAAAAVFEEVGRAAGLRLGAWRERDRSAAVWSFAAGYAGAELLLIGILGHAQLLAVAQSPDGGAALLQSLPVEAQAGLRRGLDELGSWSALWLVGERLAAVAFQIGLTLLVASAIRQRSVARFTAALVLHLLIDLPAAAYQLGRAPLWIVEPIYLLTGAVAGAWVHRHWPWPSRERPDPVLRGR